MAGATESLTNIGEKEMQIMPIMRLALGFIVSKLKQNAYLIGK